MKIFLTLCLSLTLGLLMAQEAPLNQPDAEVATSRQQVEIDGKTIQLIAISGTYKLRDEANNPLALFGYTSYMKEGAKKTRPIVFAFNGGPGSSSFWLHMGVLGPKRITVNDPDYTAAAPYQIVNNNYSILDIADLVMIDPVGTGLSVPLGAHTFDEFWGVDQDIRSISLFITQYLIEQGRMNSPKFLLGESYGTFRNAGIMDHMLNQGIAMNGVIMVSAVFDLRTLIFPPDDDIPYLMHFPTYAASAWYHNQIPDKEPNLEKFIDEIRSFTENSYAPALFKGDRISSEQKNTVAGQLAKYTGLSKDYWLKSNLKVAGSEYFAEALRSKGLVIGRLDSRYTGINQDLISQFGSHDPQSAAISPAYITGFLDYFHNTLGVRKDLQYTITAGRREGFEWDWYHKGNERWNTQAAINTAPDMARALSRDPNMKVLILNGYYDIATVFYGVEYTIDHLGLTPEIRDNIIMKYYEAGHMMYTHHPSLIKFKEDVGSFILEQSK
ncbi:MAG: carboxypeptidase [Cyclobacteriaceae bacterium]|nr:carboxypeptidase [Cyclobacteriaceae bacterium]